MAKSRWRQYDLQVGYPRVTSRDFICNVEEEPQHQKLPELLRPLNYPPIYQSCRRPLRNGERKQGWPTRLATIASYFCREPKSLGIARSPWVLEAISSMGFEKMTPVQTSTIPLFMGHKDVVVEAVTGSGKTLAFLIPVVERILRGRRNRRKRIMLPPSLCRPPGVISPEIVSRLTVLMTTGRELAAQIHSVLFSIHAFHGPSAALLQPTDKETSKTPVPLPSVPRIKPLLLLGGNTSPAQDLRNFLEWSPNLLIGTPGRLNELLASQHVHCSEKAKEEEWKELLERAKKQRLEKEQLTEGKAEFFKGFD
jgi:ATP-dependent RNA helicase DDX55/SPB4